MEVDVLGAYPPDNVEKRDRAAVAFVVHSLGQEQRVGDLKPGLLAHFAQYGVLNCLAVLDRPAETGPAVRVGDPRFVIAMMEKQTAILGHDQQHRSAPRDPRLCIR
jgi:hypothetical protein